MTDRNWLAIYERVLRGLRDFDVLSHPPTSETELGYLVAVEVGTGQAIRLTASFGITLLDPDVPVEDSIARADQALYQSKEAGRNQTRQWEPSLTPVS